MKKIYFVRHGESEGNIGPIRQTKDAHLTELGIKQAQYVVKRCRNLGTETIISSTMVRAKQTAQYIVSETKLPIEHSDLFVERRRTTLELGKPKDEPQAVEVGKAIQENFAVPGFRHSDEENFDDLKQRAKEALEYLESRTEESILVVTHGFFMRIIIAYVMFGDDLTARECQKFIQKFHMENTGITAIEGEQKEKNMNWWLWIWNDHAHLG